MRADQTPAAASDPVVANYRVALPQVYGYLLPRCGSAALAEDLTSETFLAAVSASRQGNLTEVNTAWLVGVARHKLVDHWRRLERERRSPAAAEEAVADVDDPWDDWLDTEAASGRSCSRTPLAFRSNRSSPRPATTNETAE